jgi:hypothetical protein
MEPVHRDRILGGARLRVEAARGLEHAVDQRRRHADPLEVAEADIGEGLVELPRQRLVTGAGKVDDRKTVVAHAPYLSARKGNAKAAGRRAALRGLVVIHDLDPDPGCSSTKSSHALDRLEADGTGIGGHFGPGIP